MADSKITALTAISTVDPAADPLVIVDVSDTSMAASGTTKKGTINQFLGAGGTATLASATITGDLTVDTSTLKVDSANDRVGVGTTTPSQKLEVATLGSDTRLRINSTSVVATEYFRSGTGLWLVGSDSTNAFKIARGSNFGGSADYFSIGSATADCTWFDAAGGTRMTLNSTGLGVGVVPSAGKFEVGIGAGTTTPLFRFLGNSGSWNGQFNFDASGNLQAYSYNGTKFTDFVWPYGNVGIGVTPSALNSSYKGIQVGGSTFLFNNTSGASNSFLYTNAFQDSANNTVYRANGRSSGYLQLNGEHRWFYDSGTQIANANCAFTQAMTLDASGNLLVGTTDTSSTSGAGFKIIGSGLGPYVVNAASTNAALAYTMYSTGAAAYRFYVGWGGTVFATNTTISAISDQRLKENVQDIDVGLGAILALKPRKFDWKEGKGKNIKGDRGFIAQEFEQVFPQLVDEWQDKTPEGEAPYKSVRQDLIPVLVKAIQELTARVQTLETR